jgi:predicted protein tyrosine phosphatase
MTELSQKIRDYRGGVYANPYQGTDKRVVFVCSMGILRSATAARIYGCKYNTRTAGTWPDALVRLSPELVSWADEIVFVNQSNYLSSLDRFQENEVLFEKIKKAKVLNIPDDYEHMHPKLIEAFQEQYEPLDSYQLYAFS